MIIKKARIAVFLMIFTLFLGACGADDCEEFSNEVHPTLPEGLRHHLRGFLDYNTWILTNIEGDTVIIKAKGRFEEKVTGTKSEGDPLCHLQYQGQRDFEISISIGGDTTSRFAFGLSLNARTKNTYNIFLPLASYTWNERLKKPLDNDEVLFLDSMELVGSAYLNVIVPKKFNNYPSDVAELYNEEFGFLLNSQDDNRLVIIDTVY
jgi:hypothetical protein